MHSHAKLFGRWAILGRARSGWQQYFAARNLHDARSDAFMVVDRLGLAARIVYGDDHPSVRKGERTAGDVYLDVPKRVD